MSDPQNQSVSGIRDQVALVSYIDSLIKEKGDVEIMEENLPEIRTPLLNQLNDQINTRLVSLLDDKQQEELGKLLDTEAPDAELDALFVRAIPNIEIEIAAVLIDFRTAYLGLSADTEDAVSQPVQIQPEPSQSSEPSIEPEESPAPELPAEDTRPVEIEITDDTPAEKKVVDEKTQNVLNSLSALAEEPPVSDDDAETDELMPAPPAPVR